MLRAGVVFARTCWHSRTHARLRFSFFLFYLLRCCRVAVALLAEQHEVSKLAKRTIGFDGRDFFNSFDFGLHEPLLAPTGNIPLGLEARISARIRELRSLQIEPVVVFDGMTVSRAVPPLLAQTSVKLAPAWAAAARDAHDDPAIVSAFQKKLVLTHQLASAVMCLLRSLGVEALVAPYLACAQLGKMLQHGVVQVRSVTELGRFAFATCAQ